MRSIIVPTDFSEYAWNALRCAIQYFKYERCDFHIIHTYADEVYKIEEVLSRKLLEEYKAIHKKKSEEGIAAVLARIKEYYPDPRHTYQGQAIFGGLVDEVHQLVEQHNADIVVMGSKGKTADNQVTFGSQTLQVLKYVKCPVLVVPKAYQYERPTHIAFPTNFMVPYKKRELKLLARLAKSYRSTVHLLYFSDFEKLSLRQEDHKAIIAHVFDPELLYYVHRPETDVSVGITHYAQENGIDLIALVNSRHSYMETLLEKSTIDTLSLYSKHPLLVFQNLPRS